MLSRAARGSGACDRRACDRGACDRLREPLVAVITSASAARLALAEGQTVMAVVKSTEIMVAV